MQVGSFWTEVRDSARTVFATPFENVADITRAGGIEVQGLAPAVDAIAPDSMATGDSGQSLLVQFRDTVQAPVYSLRPFDPLAAEVLRSWEAGRFNPYLGIVVSVVIGFIAGPIGAAIVGEAFAAAYPLVTAAIGQVAVQTAINGGDVESAVKNAVPGLVASYVGVGMTNATQSAVIGRAAGTAVVAAARGKNVEDAVKTSLITSGLNTASSQIFNSVLAKSDAPVAAPAGGKPMLSDSLFNETVTFPDFASDPTQTIYPDFSSDPTAFAPQDVMTSSYSDNAVIPYPANTPDMGIVIDDTGTTTGGNGRSVFDVLTDAAIAAIKINQAYRQTQAPVRANTNPSVGPVATAAGMLITRNPLTGAMQTARPPVGSPYTLADGRTIINNGDGSYQTIYPDGRSVRTAYPSTASGVPGATLVDGVPNAVLYGALGLGAILLLRK